jgi:hypothetical protein
MKRIGICFLLAFCVLLIFAQPNKPETSTPERDGNVTTVTYVGDIESIFPNPERGWYNRRGISSSSNHDFSNVVAAGHTLLHSYIRLDDFRETDQISQAFLNNLQAALDAVRNHGLKIVLRPTHVWSETPSVPEARILKHIEQLNAVISKNADVVNHLEVGWLGKWGEWHSGRYTNLSNREYGDTRYRIVQRILETTPDNIPIALRYPRHMREILDELPPPAGSEPLTQVQRDRIGHHNDCFLFNEHDRGTYSTNNTWYGIQTLEKQKQYIFDMITSYGGNKIVSGETCSPAIERIDATQTEMAKSNWTTININFWGVAIDMWRDQWLPADGNDPAESEFDRISRKLGYRLRLVDATFSTSANAGDSFTIAANLSNDGYAGVIKKRPVYLVFDNGADRYNIELTNVDLRTWLSGPVELSPQTVALPLNMASGAYKLALWLPDAAANLQSRSAYSIRFANHDIWDSTKGYNLLYDSVVISE